MSSRLRPKRHAVEERQTAVATGFEGPCLRLEQRPTMLNTSMVRNRELSVNWSFLTVVIDQLEAGDISLDAEYQRGAESISHCDWLLTSGWQTWCGQLRSKLVRPKTFLNPQRTLTSPFRSHRLDIPELLHPTCDLWCVCYTILVISNPNDVQL